MGCGERENADYYPTPEWCAEGIVRALVDSGFNAEGRQVQILDPGAGDGRLGRAALGACRRSAVANPQPFEFGAQVTGVDMVPRAEPEGFDTWVVGDYLAWDLRGWYQQKPHTSYLVICNPPFSRVQEFVEYTIQTLEDKDRELGVVGSWVALFLVRLSFLGSRRRLSFFRKYPPVKQSILVPRPSFVRGTTDNSEYAWLWWGDVCGVHGWFQWINREEIAR